VKGKAGGGGAAHHEPHTAEQRARSKWLSSREKTDRRMSSFSDCTVDPEPVAAPTPLRRLGTALPLRPRLPLASMAGVLCAALSVSLSSRFETGPDQRGPVDRTAGGGFFFSLDSRWLEPPL